MTGNAPSVVVIAGPNGAGKSTIAPSLLHGELAITEFVNADSVAKGLSGFSQDALALEASAIMLRRIRELSGSRVSFAFETTLAGRSPASWIARWLEEGYQFHLVFLWLNSPDLAVLRVADRVRAGGHGVPEDVIRRRYERGLRNFFRLYMPLATTWQILDNSDSSGPKVIAEGNRSTRERVFDKVIWEPMRRKYERG